MSNCYQCDTDIMEIGVIIWTTPRKQEEFLFCEECSKRVVAEIRLKKYKKTSYPVNAFWLKWKEADGRRIAAKKVEAKYYRLTEKIRIDIFMALDNIIAARNMMRQNKARFIPEMKYPTTWLNQECWKDQLTTEKEVKNEKAQRASSQFTTRNQQTSDAIWELYDANEASED